MINHSLIELCFDVYFDVLHMVEAQLVSSLLLNHANWIELYVLSERHSWCLNYTRIKLGASRIFNSVSILLSFYLLSQIFFSHFQISRQFFSPGFPWCWSAARTPTSCRTGSCTSRCSSSPTRSWRSRWPNSCSYFTSWSARSRTWWTTSSSAASCTTPSLRGTRSVSPVIHCFKHCQLFFARP